MAAPMVVDVSKEKSENNEISDMFKESFKFYKRRNPPPDFSNVIDFSLGDCDGASKIVPYSLSMSNHSVSGVKPVQKWKAFTLQDVPGFIFICNPFTLGGQGYWVERCLVHYHCKPYVTNLDKHYSITENLWKEHKKDKGDGDKKQHSGKSMMDKLRWATLGYHHDWDTKHYRVDHRCDMPEELVLLCRHIAATVGYPHYDPQAAIVNYYHMDSTLAGHTDHSEFDLQAPLISISFGQPAIFLLGGTSKSQRPHAMYLHSGDIVIMMRESRLAYHAVPRIVADKQGVPLALRTDTEDNEPDCDAKQDTVLDCKANVVSVNADTTAQQTCHNITDTEQTTNEAIEHQISEIDFSDYADYMKTCRLNLNVRQVLSAGETFPIEAVPNEVCKKTKIS